MDPGLLALPAGHLLDPDGVTRKRQVVRQVQRRRLRDAAGKAEEAQVGRRRSFCGLGRFGAVEVV